MTGLRFDIIPFKQEHQFDVDLLMTSIANEFEDNIFSGSPKKNKQTATLPFEKYWVACSDDK